MLHPLPHQRVPGEPIVQLQGVSCGYEKQEVLTDVTLDIMEGDFVGLLGPSGSGKTTLLRTVLGAVDVYHGQVLVQGDAPVGFRYLIEENRPYRKPIGSQDGLDQRS